MTENGTTYLKLIASLEEHLKIRTTGKGSISDLQQIKYCLAPYK